jgi:hypothetical protein
VSVIAFIAATWPGGEELKAVNQLGAGLGAPEWAVGVPGTERLRFGVEIAY